MYFGQILNAEAIVLANIVGYLFCSLYSFIFPFIIDLIGLDYTFIALACFNFLAAIYTFFDFVETKNRLKEDILIELKVIDCARVENLSDEETHGIVIHTN